MGLDERAVAAAQQWQYKSFTATGPMLDAVEVPFQFEPAGPWLVAGSKFSFPRVKGPYVPPVLSYYIGPDSEVCTKELVFVPIDLTVGKDGKPTDIRVAGTIDSRIAKAATDAAESWRFRPGTANGDREITSGTVLLRCGVPALAGNAGGGVLSVGGGTSPPAVIFKVDPEYSEEARKAKYSGSVMLSIVVDTEGRARDIKIVRALGHGLDEEAIAAVTQWRFKSGLNNGQPVKVRAQIEVNFRLL
jgi:TonB family protein